jgi:acetate kinase
VRILVVNAGSSSLKLSVLDDEQQLVTSKTIGSDGPSIDVGTLQQVIDEAGTIDAVGHRIVHGGTEFTGPVRIDDTVRRRLEALTDLAPLHQPKSLAALDAVTRLLPDLPAVACFDTAFHVTIPASAATYALPSDWRERWPLRRFGFHGLSHAYVSRRAADIVDAPVESLRIVSCHLGAGASVTAVDHGISVDTTMGFTPLEGLVMATRSGTVDPGLLLWLEDHAGLPPSDVATTLEHRSGLLGLAGSGDLRSVLQAEAAGDADAAVAIGVYLHRLRAAVAGMTAAMEGLDVLAFTGGVGENSGAIRVRTGNGLRFLGVQVDSGANDAARPDCDISAGGSAVRTLVIEAREDLQIATEVRRVLAGTGQ